MMKISHNPIKYYGSPFSSLINILEKKTNMEAQIWDLPRIPSGWSQHHIIISKLHPWAASSARKASRVYILRTGEAVKDH